MAGTFGSEVLRKNIEDMVWLSQLPAPQREAELAMRRDSGGRVSLGPFDTLAGLEAGYTFEVGYATDRLCT